MSDRYLASIIVNNYNYGRFLADAIDSALNQTYPELEIIVVDDGSTDNSREIIAAYGDRITAVFKANGGQASAFNAGFLASQGQMVIFLDADDMLLPTAVSSVVDVFKEAEVDHVNVAKVHWPMWEVDEHGQKTGGKVPPGDLGAGDLRELVARDGPGIYVSPPTTGNAWHRRFLRRVFPVPESDFAICADGYLFALAPLYGEIRRIETPHACYRRHGKNNYAELDFEVKLKRGSWNYDRHCQVLRKHCLDLGIDVDPERWRDRSWADLVLLSLLEIVELVPPNHHFILVDQGEWGCSGKVAGRQVFPLMERDGRYWGPPANDAIAIEELERLRLSSAGLIAFAWSAFWWLDYYTGFHQYLRATYRCVLENDRLVAFDLQSS